MSDGEHDNEQDNDAEYLLEMELFEIDQAFLYTAFDEEGDEVELE